MHLERDAVGRVGVEHFERAAVEVVQRLDTLQEAFTRRSPAEGPEPPQPAGIEFGTNLQRAVRI